MNCLSAYVVGNAGDQTETKQENPKISWCRYSQLIFGEGAMDTEGGKNSFFNKWCEEKCITTYKSEIGLLPYTVHKIQLKMFYLEYKI